MLLNKIRDKRTEDFVCKKLKDRGLRPIGVIHEESSVALSWLEEKPLEGPKADGEMVKTIQQMEQDVREQQEVS